MSETQSDLFAEGALPPQQNKLGITSESTLPAVLRAFEQHMQEEGFARNTVKAFASDVRLLYSFLEDMPINEIGTADLNKFMNWLVYERGVPCSKKTYARRVTTLKVMFAWLTENGILHVDPALEVVQISVSSPLPVIPNDAQVEQALAVTEAWRNGRTITDQQRKKDARPHLLLTLLLQTGSKKGEAKGLLLEHIERDDVTNPQIFVRYTNPRLKYKERKLAIDPEWLDTLDEYVGQYNIADEIFTCTPRNLEYILRDVGDEAELARGLLSFENLRWTSALLDLKKGTDEELIREKLGISKITWRETKNKLEQLWDQQKKAAQEAEQEDRESAV